MEVLSQIQVKNRKTGERKHYRIDQEKFTIGRDRSNFIPLDNRTVSRRHTEIRKEGEHFFVEDLKSNNGTALNDKQLTPKEKMLLQSGDIIRIEDYDLLFHVPKKGEIENIYEATDSDIMEVKMVKKLLSAMDRENSPSLEVTEGAYSGRQYVIEGKTKDITIGRDASCEFRIDADVISRRHARIEKRFDSITLYDLKSKNGSFVNRERIKEKTLKDGDVIQLGTLTLVFKNPQELLFTLSPPKVKKEPPPPPSKPSSRASTKRPAKEEKPPAPKRPTTPQPEEPVSVSTHSQQVPSGFNLPPSEILMIIVGLVVLIGSLWGIMKLLK